VPDTVYIFKGKAQTREGQTSLLLESMQTYVDLPKMTDEDDAQFQQPLLAVAPTFNGMALHEDTEFYSNGGDEGGNEVSEEDEAPSEDGDPIVGAPAVLTDGKDDDQAGLVTMRQAVSPRPVGNQTVIRGRHGHAATIDEINAQLSVADEDVDPSAIAQPSIKRVVAKPANGAADRPKNTLSPAAALTLSQPAPAPRSERQAMEMLRTTPKPNEHAAIESSPAPATVAVATGVSSNGRHLHITFRRSGNLERDKFRLKEIYDYVRDPRGRDRFFIRLEYNGQAHELTFPNDPCNISERLVQHLTKHFRVEVAVVGDK
jgi:hypothetical protein